MLKNFYETNYYNVTANLWNYKLKENMMYGSNRLGIYKSETVLDITGTAPLVGNGSTTGSGSTLPTTPTGKVLWQPDGLTDLLAKHHPFS